ncbi:MAG: AmmeMemoRadiSam system protein B [Elusimicrobia bacterium]|nr:AmmeMemoRadiSam system protein B [Elusimicrobiota bacterium]
MQRKSAKAGSWYPATAASVKRDIASYLPPEKITAQKAIGIMVPHAGWLYSGRVAAQVYARVKIPGTIVMIGPNHTSLGYMVSLSASDTWDSPLGEIRIDKALSKKITELSGGTVTLDENAHKNEHSLEIQLPFLQYFCPEIKIVPLILGTQAPAICRILGAGIAGAIRESQQDVLILASSDMNHFENIDTTRKKDDLALREILSLNPENLLQTVRENDISMCGVAPTAAMLFAAKSLGAAKTQLVIYDTSGTVTGDNKEVVGYAGVIVS